MLREFHPRTMVRLRAQFYYAFLRVCHVGYLIIVCYFICMLHIR